MALQIHLPLNPIDSVNRPPLKFLQVQDGLVVLTGGLWTAAYILYILQARKDHSYGMPVIALCANIAWEAIYAVFYPLSAGETFTFVFWLAIDLGIVHSTITNAPGEWKQAPLIANHMGLIIAFGSTLFLLLHWALITTIGSPDDAGLWSGFATQVLLGFGSVVHLLSRNSTRGHSLTIWACRWIGSLSAVLMFLWRYAHYPRDYPLVGTPMALFLFAMTEVADILYIFLYLHISKKEKVKAH